MRLNVELPENLGETLNETAPPAAIETKADGFEIGNAKETSQEEVKKPETIQDILDLDKHDRFRWNGREWTKKDLLDGTMMRADYTRKTQEHGKAVREFEKYRTNFNVDVQKVLDDRSLVEEFKRIYPKEFHELLDGEIERFDRLASRGQGDATKVAVTPNPSDDVQRLLQRELKPILEWKNQVEKERAEATQKANIATLDAWEQKLSKKYPSGRISMVEAEAQALLDADPTLKMTEDLFEKLYKKNHEEMESWYTDRRRQENEKQKAASERAKDIGAGGSTPGAAPLPMSVKEATKRLYADLER